MKLCKVVPVFDLAQDRDQWRALVNKVINFPGFIKGGEFIDRVSEYNNFKKVSATWGYLAIHISKAML
jgi:hypothetical protein